MTRTLILGCDAALRRTGLALLSCDLNHPTEGQVIHSGIISTNERHNRANRLRDLHDQMGAFLDVIGLFSDRTDFAAVEAPGPWARAHGKSSQMTVEALAQARAVILLALAQHGIAAMEVTTSRAKQSVAGPHATKETVQKQLKLLGLYDGGDPDIADAVTVALAGAGVQYQDAILSRAARTPARYIKIRRKEQ